MNLQSSLTALAHSWIDFWFESEQGVIAKLNLVRVSTCLLVGIWLSSFLGGASFWFGSTGVVDSRLAGLMINFEETSRWQHWSPLWLVDGNFLITMWLILGIILSLISAIGLGGRATLLVLALVVISWIHRIVWLQGPFGPLAVAILLILCIAPTRNVFAKPQNPVVPEDNLDLAHFAVKLIQAHWFIVFAAGFLTQLAGLTWWQGEAAWWLVAEGKAMGITVKTVGGQPLLVNFLTHAMLGIQLLALWLLTTRTAKGPGIVCASIAGLLVCLLGGQMLYGLLLAGVSLAFFPYSEKT